MKSIPLLFVVGALLLGSVSFRNALSSRMATLEAERRPAVDTLKIDAESGLINDPNLVMVKAQCTACHSSKLIVQHRFTRAGWVERKTL